MEINNELVIDQALGLKLAGGKADLAQEMLELLVSTLPNEISDLKTQFQKQDYPELQKRLHKLHGAVCYCGLPRLKRVIFSFESALKEGITSAYPQFMTQLEFEVTQVLNKVGQIKKN